MARKLPPNPRLRRRTARRTALPEIVVVCEGKLTEPEYIKAFARERGNHLVSIRIIDAAGIPMSVVATAIDARKEKRLQARKSGDSFEKVFQVWAVFDRDEHPGFDQACREAAAAEVGLATSNPCFEIWALLHFREVDGPLHRHEAQARLRDVMPSYHHERNAIFDYAQLSPKYEIAVRNAIRGLRRREEERDPRGNPCSTAHELFEEIARYGRGYYSQNEE